MQALEGTERLTPREAWLVLQASDVLAQHVRAVDAALEDVLTDVLTDVELVCDTWRPWEVRRPGEALLLFDVAHQLARVDACAEARFRVWESTFGSRVQEINTT